ncbi:MAG: HhH-GPD-type base excision DNA repair protein [Candidatus Limnocylindrales bacterium]|nr:HhH-GPD-type base excision DNA repair protein [Candidatus Limnocylindrales bacterium]
MTTAVSLPFTGDDAADRLLVEEPLALLIGFALDQQVTVQKAFSGPAELKRRLGHLDAARIAAMDPGELDSVFRERPALHRFPGAMAAKVQALCNSIARDFGNDARRVWSEAPDGPSLESRLLSLPGIGEMKAKTLIAVLGKRFGIRPPGTRLSPRPGRRSATSTRPRRWRATRQASAPTRPPCARPPCARPSAADRRAASG